MFSSENQPTAEQRKRTVCLRGGHSIEDGSGNVRIRPNGERLCRACESSRRKTKRVQTAQETKLIEAGIPTPFSWANLWYEPEIYEATPLPVLIDFVRFQRSVLEKANVMTGPGWWIDVNGERAQLRKDLVLETLPGEILVTQSVLTRKTLEEIERQDAEGTGETVQPTEEAARMPGEAF